MIVPLCYRCIPNGEIIHTRYNTLTGQIGYLPETVYDPDYLIRDEEDCYNAIAQEEQLDAVLESFLQSNIYFWCVHPIRGITYAVYHIFGSAMIGPIPEGIDEDPETQVGSVPQLHTTEFMHIGYRLTRPMQFRYKTKVYGLTYDPKRNKVITNDGDLDIELDINTLSTPDPAYAGYKEMVAEHAYALVYVNKVPTLLYKDNNKLICK